MNTESQPFWRKCSSCKKPIALGAKYYICSVSTCNGQRTGYVFCSVGCFETHLPGARHRDAGAIEKQAPMTPDHPDQGGAAVTSDSAGSAPRSPARIIVKSSNPSAVTSTSRPQLPRETLIIASRLKEYIQAKADYNTSASVMDVLSDYVRVLCDQAIDNARSDGRKTVMDRDFDFLKRG